MPFGLANAPSSFQNYINDTLKGYLDEFCTAYIDDILIFSETFEEHQEHVKKVLARILAAGLQIDIKKCEFHVQSIKFLGLIITTDGIKMDPTKLQIIKDWPRPKNVKEIQRFIGFANFYRRFINKFSSLVSPLTNLMKKGSPFDWGPSQEIAFATIKEKFCEDIVLRHLIGKSLLDLRPMHPTYDKELLAIVQAFEEWRPELEGTLDPVEVITDHKALEYFMKSCILSRRQARWSEFLSRFNFKICYRPGTLNGPADNLSRPGVQDPSCKEFLEQRLLKPHCLSTGMGENLLAVVKTSVRTANRNIIYKVGGIPS
ncbi:hypothetical protein K3495_g15379 [Podosphaera aphanis]|nr:hypothetical protein K3495_g15379 [Podosphaera aphanis]